MTLLHARARAVGRTPIVQPRVPRLLLPTAYPSGLIGWFAPSAEPEGDGVSLGAITNRVNGSRLVNQTTVSAMPVMRRGVNGIANRDAVQFSPNQFLSLMVEGANWLNGVPGFTYVIAATVHDISGTRAFMAISGADASLPTKFGLEYNVGTLRLTSRRLDTDSASILSSAAVLTNDVPFIVQSTVDYATDARSIWLNGALVATVAAGQGSGLSDASTSLRGRMAAGRGSSPAGFYDGKQAIQAFWQQAYTAAQLAPLVQSWCRHYGVAYAG